MCYMYSKHTVCRLHTTWTFLCIHVSMDISKNLIYFLHYKSEGLAHLNSTTELTPTGRLF